MSEGAELTAEPSSDEQIVTQLGQSTSRTAWRIFARNQARNLFDLVREAESTQTLDQGQVAQALLIRKGVWRAAAAASFRAGYREQLKDWYSGAGVETARSELHHAEERLLLVQSPVAVKDRIAEIDAALRSNLKDDDTRLTPAANRLKDLAKLDPTAITQAAREELRGYQQLANSSDEQAHANVRSLRNLLIVVGFFVSFGLAVLSLLHAVAPGFLELSGPKPAKGPAPADVEVWQVVAVGALGGMIAAVFTISKLGGFGGAYRLPVYQALIRVPAGALVALAAVILLQSGQVKGLSPQTGLGVYAVGLVFGYAPDVLLRIMDKKATSLLGDAQSKDDPARPPLAKPRAQV